MGAANPKFRIKNGRIKQSIMGWTFNPMPTPELAKLCKEIGLVAMEGISPKHYPMIKDLGLDISLVGSHGFKKGPVDPVNHDECVEKLTDAIELCADAGYKAGNYFHGHESRGDR
jgi:hydroxypyruvate isomerase